MTCFCSAAMLPALWLWAGSLVSAGQVVQKPKTDAERLQGKWSLVAYTVHGHEAADGVLKKVEVQFGEAKIMIKPMIVSSTEKKTGMTSFQLEEREFEAKFELGSEGKLKTIDLITGGDDARRLRGIYRLDGDEMSICYTTEDERPTAFESKPESYHRLLLLKRVKP